MISISQPPAFSAVSAPSRSRLATRMSTRRSACVRAPREAPERQAAPSAGSPTRPLRQGLGQLREFHPDHLETMGRVVDGCRHMTTHPSRYVFGKIRPVSDPVRNRTQQPGLTGERKESIPPSPHRRYMVDAAGAGNRCPGGWARGHQCSCAHPRGSVLVRCSRSRLIASPRSL